LFMILTGRREKCGFGTLYETTRGHSRFLVFLPYCYLLELLVARHS
jgi:hypothetical protein